MLRGLRGCLLMNPSRSSVNTIWTGTSPTGNNSYPRSLLASDSATHPRTRIKWMFTTAKARAKRGRAYPLQAAPNALGR
jgi:hypothetical protein